MKKTYMNPTMRVVPIRFNTILANSLPVGDDGNANDAEHDERKQQQQHYRHTGVALLLCDKSYQHASLSLRLRYNKFLHSILYMCAKVRISEQNTK